MHNGRFWQLYYFFIYCFCVLLRSQEYFTRTAAVSIMFGGKPFSSPGKPSTIRRSVSDIHAYARRKAIMHELALNSKRPQTGGGPRHLMCAAQWHRRLSSSNRVALSSIPGHAHFLSGRTWEGPTANGGQSCGLPGLCTVTSCHKNMIEYWVLGKQS